MKRRQKRRLTVLAVVVAALLVVAGTLWTYRTPLLQLVPTPPVVVTEKDQGRTINLLAGQRLEVRLPSNAHTDSTWRATIPLSFLPQTGDPTFTGAANAVNEGDGYQSTIFTATGKGFGPLFLGYLPNNDQNSYSPSRSFTVIVRVQ
jgi:predicted secreted protein